jgi:hypothetical protein
MLGLVIACAASAVASSSASALRWIECKDQPNLEGFYKDNQCKKLGPPDLYAWVLIPANVRLTIVLKGGLWIVKTKAHGIKFEIKCEKEEGKGWIENPTGGGNGIDLHLVLFSACTVLKPSGFGCVVEEPIHIVANTELRTIGGEIWDVFTPDPAGGPFGTITISGCTGSASVLNGSYNLEGKTDGRVVNEGSSFKFSATENDELTFAGEAATLEGESTAEVEGGGAIGAE